MREPDAALGGLVGSRSGKRNVLAPLEADSDQVASQGFGHVQAGSDVSQAVWPSVVVQRHIDVGRHHRDLQSRVFDDRAQAGQRFGWRVHTSGTGPHADGVVTAALGNRNQFWKWNVEASLACGLDNPHRQ